MVTKASKIDFIETDSVLEAIILESNEIKKYLPYYNTKEKDNKSYNFVVITQEEFPRLVVVRGRILDKFNEGNLGGSLGYKIKYQFGPYPTGSLLRDALKIIRKIFPFRDEKAKLKYQESFYKSLGLSPDTTTPQAKKEYQKTIRNLVLFFQGKKKELIKTLEKEMNEYAENKDFEKAGEIRNTLYALSHIQDVSLIKDDKTLEKIDTNSFRIEAYDVSHFGGKGVVGVMTVIENGEINKNEYRKFKIKVDKNDDTGALREVLSRRLKHTEWQKPNLIVIDGGIGQINTAKDIVGNIEVVSVVKNDTHKPDHILGNEEIIKKHQKEILLVNAEAHRFAIAYQKNLREIK
jgi:excinuclease ABC subunit C